MSQANVSRSDPRGSVLFTAWVAIVLLVVMPPLWVALALSPSRDGAMRLVRRWARRVLALCGCAVRVQGLEHLDAERCAIVVANHSSYLDSVVLLATIESDYRFVANRRELARPFVGLVLRKGRHLVVDRRSRESRVDCTRAMLDTLRQGTSLVLFPEGTRSAETLQTFRNGAFRASVKTGCPVLPVAISGTSRILPRRGRLLRRSPIEVQILPAIRPGVAAGAAVVLRERTAAAISGVLGTV
jgi:1-acyl-sn-glycerol-3-phosphate acyltransferase